MIQDVHVAPVCEPLELSVHLKGKFRVRSINQYDDLSQPTKITSTAGCAITRMSQETPW